MTSRLTTAFRNVRATKPGAARLVVTVERFSCYAVEDGLGQVGISHL